MNNNSDPSRREFIEGLLASGAAFAFAGLARGAQDSNNPGEPVLPLATQRIPQPDNNMCSWPVFSPVDDRIAYASGILGEVGLYVSRAGQPEIFDVLWKPSTEGSGIQRCAWSPDGKEIAFIAVYGNKETSPKFSKISICVADVDSGQVREPVVISEYAGNEKRQSTNVSYQKGLSWWGNSCICVPAGDGNITKFDTHTGQSEILVPACDGMTESNPTMAPSGELRFIKSRWLGPNQGGEFVVAGCSQNGSIHDYVNLTNELGQIFGARLSQNGDFAFAEKRDTSAIGYPPTTILIYKVDTRTVIAQIPQSVDYKDDTYIYIPVTMLNDKDLVLLEMIMMAVDGDSPMRRTTVKAVKMTL
jgi:hypothetical protein